MAHQYISKENQTLLWKTIQRSPQFVNNTVSINREKWFSNIIRQFYETISSPKMSIAELKAMNQQTIAYMLNNLKHIENSRNFSAGAMQTQTQTQTHIHSQAPIISTNYETPQTRMTMYNEQFNARQQEYANMIKPPAPPIASFGEKLEDEAITNMDELLQQQIKQREYDIANIKPQSPINNDTKQTNVITEPAIYNNDNGNNNSVIMNAINELTKQLAELRAEIDLLKKQEETKSSSKIVELHGVEQ